MNVYVVLITAWVGRREKATAFHFLHPQTFEFPSKCHTTKSFKRVPSESRISQRLRTSSRFIKESQKIASISRPTTKATCVPAQHTEKNDICLHVSLF